MIKISCVNLYDKIRKVTHNLYIFFNFEACRLTGRKLLLPTDAIFFSLVQGESHLIGSQLLLFKGKSLVKKSFSVVLKWTTVVLTPLYIMHQGLCCHFFYACHLAFWMGMLHTPRVSIRVIFLDFLLVWQLHSDQIISGPLPPCKNPPQMPHWGNSPQCQNEWCLADVGWNK